MRSRSASREPIIAPGIRDTWAVAVGVGAERARADGAIRYCARTHPSSPWELYRARHHCSPSAVRGALMVSTVLPSASTDSMSALRLGWTRTAKPTPSVPPTWALAPTPQALLRRDGWGVGDRVLGPEPGWVPDVDAEEGLTYPGRRRRYCCHH